MCGRLTLKSLQGEQGVCCLDGLVDGCVTSLSLVLRSSLLKLWPGLAAAPVSVRVPI